MNLVYPGIIESPLLLGTDAGLIGIPKGVRVVIHIDKRLPDFVTDEDVEDMAALLAATVCGLQDEEDEDDASPD